MELAFEVVSYEVTRTCATENGRELANAIIRKRVSDFYRLPSKCSLSKKTSNGNSLSLRMPIESMY